jgi:uncharacterized SAM-binding protein YcdF (DUF218 family)
MKTLIGLAVLWIVWLTAPRRWKRQMSLLLIGIAAVLVAVSPLGLELGIWGLTIAVPPDSGEKVDAIVVLGRGDAMRDQRVATVQELWQRNRAPQIFASGMLDARPIVRELQAIGIPKQRLDGEECSQSTEENAQFTQAILHPQGVQTILLVTDAPHMLRSVLTFRSFGFRTIPHPSPLPTHLLLQEELRILLREYLGLAQYALTGQFNPHSPKLMQAPLIEVTQKISSWGCRVQKKQ